MRDRNWGAITDGATFEALVARLVFFEDPKAMLFERLGRDGGQDMRSSDGTCVFQAKHHQSPSAATAIADAKREASKIASYREPGHERYAQWQGVTHWRLVTNALFNPTDQERWDDEVVPVFRSQGLIAEYWGRSQLDALLDKHPEVDRFFFGNQTRAFLTLPEARERIASQETVLKRGTPTPFVGRGEELDQVARFMSSDSRFLVIHGSGGIGKTRLLIEAGEEIASTGRWQVLWANAATMLSSGTWFDGIVPERPTLLLVDEPEDEQLMKILDEQQSSRTADWKVAISVRSPKDPVMRWFGGARTRKYVDTINLDVLRPDEAEQMCMGLLSSGPLGTKRDTWRKEVAHELAGRFSYHPVWLTIAVHVLETSGDLAGVPQTADSLAELYLEEIIKCQKEFQPEQVRSLLRWVALVGAVNRESDAAIGLLREGSGVASDTSVREMLARLVARGGLAQRGARNRLVELKPDVLRDHVLIRWLSVDVGYGETPMQPSDAARTIVDDILRTVLQGNISQLGQAVFVSMARTEFLLKLSGTPVPLLKPFFDHFRDHVETTSASVRLVIAELLPDVAQFYPIETVELSRAFRSVDAGTDEVQGVFGSYQVGQDDVVLALAWPVFHAAMGAQTKDEREQVIGELCALVEAEADIAARRAGGLPNDGKRAAQLVKRVIGGGPQFWSDFQAELCTVVSRLLAEAVGQPTYTAKLAALKSLLGPYLELGREQVWSEGDKLNIGSVVMLPGSPAWKARQGILNQVRGYLADQRVTSEVRLVFWAALVNAHRNANQCRKRDGESLHSELRDVLLDDLVWARSLLSQNAREFEELKAARELWRWHDRFDDDPEFKRVSRELENLYEMNDLAGEFEPLFRSDDPQRCYERWDEKAAQLAANPSCRDIKSFVDRAFRFAGERRPDQLQRFAWNLGAHADTSDSIGSFIAESLAEPETSRYTDFSITAACSWIMKLRRTAGGEAAHRLVDKLVNTCSDDERRIRLIKQVYDRPVSREDGRLCPAQHSYLRSKAKLFLDNGQGPDFIKIAVLGLSRDWPELKGLVERTLNEIPREQLGDAVVSLVRSAYWALDEDKAQEAPPDFGIWLLDQVLLLPDLSVLSNTAEWELAEILKRVGRLPVTWLPGALQRRVDMEAQDESGRVIATDHGVLLSRCVAPITKAHVGNPEISKAIAALIDLSSNTGTTRYYLPRLLLGVDPEGLVVPQEVANRLRATSSLDDLRRLARIAGGYAIASPPWRTIAQPLVEHAGRESRPLERRRLFSALMPKGARAWWAAPGGVPQEFVDGVQRAQELLDAETDTAFRAFWEWHLEVAKAEFRREEEEAKEERGGVSDMFRKRLERAKCALDEVNRALGHRSRALSADEESSFHVMV